MKNSAGGVAYKNVAEEKKRAVCHILSFFLPIMNFQQEYFTKKTSRKINNSNNVSTNNSSDTYDLHSLRKKNPERVILSHLNINSLRNKFDFLVPLVKDHIDVLMLSETKLDDSFPQAQFQMSGYSMPYRLNRNQNGGGIMLYVREDIPSKLVKSNLNSEKYECILIELNLRKKSGLLFVVITQINRLYQSI